MFRTCGAGTAIFRHIVEQHLPTAGFARICIIKDILNPELHGECGSGSNPGVKRLPKSAGAKILKKNNFFYLKISNKTSFYLKFIFKINTITGTVKNH